MPAGFAGSCRSTFRFPTAIAAGLAISGYGDCGTTGSYRSPLWGAGREILFLDLAAITGSDVQYAFGRAVCSKYV